jgi:hypothetical protein
MPQAGLEPATPATKRPQTYTLDRAANGAAVLLAYFPKMKVGLSNNSLCVCVYVSSTNNF